MIPITLELAEQVERALLAGQQACDQHAALAPTELLYHTWEDAGISVAAARLAIQAAIARATPPAADIFTP